MMFSMKMRALETAIFMPGGEQKLLMELFRENPHHLVSAVYAPDPCGYTENGQKRQ
ncbi:hypothetical protein SAMN05192569_10461 [Parageobacillus thermantarcticus]|uniref:Uncharacterized protein n=1 Tax=Parageobacillus thermantarcticus TaxID=186116 RepID=A0A1I0TQ45_9BACL|nr:hypothetical protein SAMN05192569_10461 [Parageobacillus thermantarcticus]